MSETFVQRMEAVTFYPKYAMDARLAALRIAAEADKELASVKNRARKAGQILIEAIGATGPECVDETAKRAVEKIKALEQYHKLFDHAIDCVDRVFQVDNTKSRPLLPDFLRIGDDKFMGVVRLAEMYKDLLKQCEGLRASIEREAMQVATFSNDSDAKRLARKLLEFIGLNA